eukprot:5237649-Pyramimonas_sp.AAC.1
MHRRDQGGHAPLATLQVCPEDARVHLVHRHSPEGVLDVLLGQNDVNTWQAGLPPENDAREVLVPRLVRRGVALLGAALVRRGTVPNEAALVAYGAVRVMLGCPRHGSAHHLAE